MGDPQPQRLTSFQKLLAWAILGGFSVLFAEIILGSYPFAFFDLWGLFVVCPLYTLHLLVLARIAFWRGPPRFPTLFFAGVLIGLYEAYMTKMLWNPNWGTPPAVILGGVPVIETIILIFWWHPFMAFLVPLLVGETVLCRSRHVARALPERLRRILFGRRATVVLVVLAVLAGLLASGANNTRPSVVHILVSIIPSAVVLLALVWLWRRTTRGVRMSLPDLLPTNREFVLLCVCLGLLYVGLGIVIRPDALPGLGPQASIWLVYAVMIAGLWLALRRPRPPSALEVQDPPDRFAWKLWLALLGLQYVAVGIVLGQASIWLVYAVMIAGLWLALRRPWPPSVLELQNLPDRFAWKLWLALAGVTAVTAVVTRLALGPGTQAFLNVSLAVGAPIGVATLVLCILDLVRRRPAQGCSSRGEQPPPQVSPIIP
jgi:hypothetical protein